MVDISAKTPTLRTARAVARLRISAAAAEALRTATLPKGDAFVAAQVAGIMAAKRTATLIPLAHPIPIDGVEIAFSWESDSTLTIEAGARTTAGTGVEMEAMVAVTVAALTLYDMAKGLDKGIVIEEIALVEKTGGKSGSWRRA